MRGLIAALFGLVPTTSTPRPSTRRNARPKLKLVRRVHAMSIKLTGLDDQSTHWATIRWHLIRGSTYIRVCYADGEFPNDTMALRAAQRHMDHMRHDDKRLRFRVEESDAAESVNCLLDDAVDLFPPQILVTRKTVRLLAEGEICMDNYMDGHFTQ